MFLKRLLCTADDSGSRAAFIGEMERTVATLDVRRPAWRHERRKLLQMLKDGGIDAQE